MRWLLLCPARFLEWLRSLFRRDEVPKINSFLFIEPVKHYLDYGSLVMRDIVKANSKPEYTVRELQGEAANPAAVDAAIAETDPSFLFGVGHGAPCAFSVECTAAYMSVKSGSHRACDQDRRLDKVSGRVIHLNSCLPPDGEIICNPHVKTIPEVSIGNLVLTHKGRFRPVTETFVRDYSGKLVEIVPKKFLFPLRVTEEHPVLIVKARKCTKILGNPRARYLCLPRANRSCEKGRCARGKVWTKCHPCGHQWPSRKDAKDKRCWTCGSRDVTVGEEVKRPWEEYKLEWVEAREVDENCLLAYPILYETLDINTIKLTDYWSPDEGRWEVQGEKIILERKNLEVDNEIKISSEFMELCGLFVAEGHTDDGTIQLSLGSHEIKLAERATELFKEVFGLEANTLPYPEQGSFLVRTYCKPVAEFFKSFGSHAPEKRVPDWILTLPEHKQEAFLKGLFAGDGHLTMEGYPVLSTSSKTLAFQVQLMLLRLGRIPQVRHDENAKSNIGIYRLMVPLRNREGWFWNDYALLPIKEIRHTSYEGKVYNLEVEEDNSYVTPSATVHNCLTGQELGPAIRAHGAKAYVGSTDSFWFFIGSPPNSDRVSRTVFLAEYQVEVSLMAGLSVDQAWRDSQARYDEEIAYWTTGEGRTNPNAASLVRILQIDKSLSTMIGEGGTRVSPPVPLPVAWMATAITGGMSPLIAVGAVISSDQLDKFWRWLGWAPA